MVRKAQPNPGSKAAKANGCKCPMVDNNYGAGRGDGSFYVNLTCPLHGKERPG